MSLTADSSEEEVAGLKGRLERVRRMGMGAVDDEVDEGVSSSTDFHTRGAGRVLEGRGVSTVSRYRGQRILTQIRADAGRRRRRSARRAKLHRPRPGWRKAGEVAA